MPCPRTAPPDQHEEAACGRPHNPRSSTGTRREGSDRRLDCRAGSVIMGAATLVAVLAGAPVNAFFLDDELMTPYEQAARADLVFSGTVSTLWYDVPSPMRNMPYTRVLIDVDDTYKGGIASGSIILTLPGGYREDGSSTYVVGTPKFAIGDRLLLHAVVLDEEHVRLLNWSIGLLDFGPDGALEPKVLDAQGQLVGDLSVLDDVVYAEDYVAPISPTEAVEVVLDAIAMSEDDGEGVEAAYVPGL